MSNGQSGSALKSRTYRVRVDRVCRMMSRWAKSVGFAIIAVALLIVAGVVLLNANLRGVIERVVSDRTGRQLAIKGDLQWKLDWPHARLHALDVTFANPAWARE